MNNPWEDSLQGWILHRKMSHAQPQIHFRKHTEQHQKHLQDEQQAPRNNKTQKQISPMMPPSYFIFRRALNTSFWKIWMSTIFFPIKKTNENGKRKLTQWQFK